MKNARNICEVASRNKGADKQSYSAVVSNSPVFRRVNKADAVAGGKAVNGNTGVKMSVAGGCGMPYSS